MEHTHGPHTLYSSDRLSRNTFVISTDEEKKHLADLADRSDIEATRMKRYLAMPDLARTEGSPLHEIVRIVSASSTFKHFDQITIPEIVPARESFDLFNFPAEHPARSTSDTYYIDDKNILRTHTTVMWYYYLNLPEIKEKIAQNKTIGVFCTGKVYRKDEIDRRHMNIFHQIDGLYLCPKTDHVINQDDLKAVLVEVAQSVFGKTIKYRFNPDTFPYTTDSLEMEVDKDSASGETEAGKETWVEVLGAGIVHGSVLETLGVDPKKYNGWAFGFGLERLAIIGMELPDIRLLWSDDERVKKQLHLGQKFVEVSKYPAVVRDISFIVSSTFTPNNYFDLVRDVIGDLAEEVQLLDKYENSAKFGEGNVSYAYRITYRSLDRTLTNNEVDELHTKLEEKTKEIYAATIR